MGHIHSNDSTFYMCGDATITSSVTDSTVSYNSFATGEHEHRLMGNDYLTGTYCAGHVTDEAMVEYYDGVVIAYCTNCNTRITIGRVPGGINSLKLTSMLALVREGNHADALEAILELETNLTDEIETLTNSLELVRAAKDQTCKQLLP